MEKYDMPEPNSLDSMEGVPIFYNKEDKENFEKNINSLRSKFDDFLDKQDSDFKSYYYSSVTLSGELGSSWIGVYGFKEEFLLSLQYKVKIAIDLILKKIKMYEDGNISLEELNASNLINHNLHNAYECYQNLDELNHRKDYIDFWILRGKSLEIEANPNIAAAAYRMADPIKFKDKISELENEHNRVKQKETRNKEEVDKKEYDLLKEYLESIKGTHIMEIDIISETDKLIKKLKSYT